MPISPERFIQCQTDGYISVRTFDKELLGCIPGNPPQEDFIQTPIGQIPVYAAVIYCIVPSKDQLARLRELPGFVPADEQSLDLGRSIAGTTDEQADLAEQV